MMEVRYGKEPADSKLLTLLFLRKIWIPVVTTLIGLLLIGGTYFLTHVVYGPARQYEAVTDFYIDYAVQENGEAYTYFNQTTWTQLMQDDVFTTPILAALRTQGYGEEVLDESMLKSYLYATMLSDTRIVTTTVTTNDPELTMVINAAVIEAMYGFGERHKEIAGIEILEEPTEASLVALDVRTFRACMLGAISFLVVTLFVMWLKELFDDSIVVPRTIEVRYGIPAVGTIHSAECEALTRKLTNRAPVLVTGDPEIDLLEVKEALAKKGIVCESVVDLSGELPETKLMELDGMQNLMLVIKAEAHNGKRIEKMVSLAKNSGGQIACALLWDADEQLIKRYEGVTWR
ncbi:MAG: hypothetical protein K6G23_02490 [Lachnospiraceae bacterium]|nr:hypothetical protein [Lachnospiraceae bacterium]